MKKKRILISALLVMVFGVTACGTGGSGGDTNTAAKDAKAEREPARGILLSTTIGPVDAGIIDALSEAYTAQNPDITVRYLARGTGAAIETAKGGNIDMVIVHAKSLEEAFVEEGYGTERIDFMYNDFVLVGPKDDPAGAKEAGSITEALEKISEGNHQFVSRGDKSGTHVKEEEIWAASGIQPTGEWYDVYEKGKEGNKATILYTDEQGAYTIIDRATVITNKEALKNLEVLYENDEVMLNYITIIPCDPEKMKNINSEDAADFIAWLTGDEAQEIIKNFGVEKYGEPLFYPNAK